MMGGASAHHARGSTPGSEEEPSGPATPLEIKAGGAPGELTFTLPAGELAVGTYAITFVNEGKAPHSLSFPALGKSSGAVPGGASKTMTVTFARPGTVEFVCAEPGHAGAGMKGTLTIR